MKAFVCRLFFDERGQDLIEYILLTAVVALASIAVFGLIRTAIATAFGSWNSGTNNIWQSPAPSGS